jgi:hypothetical protein
MKTLLIFSLSLLFSSPIFAQEKLEDDIDIAFQNSKKGIYWALSNIPEKKLKLENELIANDKLYAVVKLAKEINGVKIESTGYNGSNEVTIKTYRSNDFLIKHGYIRKEQN